MITFKKNTVILVVLVLLTYFVGNAQKMDRLELHRGSVNDHYWVAPAGKDGLVVIFKNGTMSSKENHIFEFVGYDSNFKKRWKSELDFADEQILNCYERDNKNIYIILSSENYGLGSEKKFTIVQLNILTGEIKKMEGTLPDYLTPRHIKAMDGVLVWGGEVMYDLVHQQTVLLYTNMNKLSTKILEIKELGDVKGSTQIDEIKTDSIAKCFKVFKTRWLQTKSHNIDLKVYNLEGEVVNRDVIELDHSFHILNTHETFLDSSARIFTGNFSYNSNFDLKIKFGPPRVTYVDGIYICKKNRKKTEFSRTYSFREISSFWNYVSLDNFTKKELKKQAKKEAGDKSSGLKSDYLILSHDVILKDSTYILVAEVQLNVNGYNQSFIGTKNLGIGDQVSSQLVYTIVCCFDLKGNLLWDKTLKGTEKHMFDSKRERVKNYIQNDELIVYGIGNYAVTKNVIKSGVVQGTEQVIDLQGSFEYPVDTLHGFEGLEMVFWFDDYLLIWGYQIYDPNPKIFMSAIDRRIYYLRKMKYSD